MTEYGSTWERVDLGGGQFQLTQHMRPISYFENGAYRPMSTDYLSDGSGGHIITDSPMRVSIGDDANGRATRRIHPTRELDVWAEIGRPYNVATREPYPLNAFTRSGNLLTSENNLADIHIWHGGHFSKLGIRLKSTWRTSPPAQFAFPVALQGLTWEGGGVIAKDGVPVMHLKAPVMYDFQNPDLVRPIPWDFEQVEGQWYVIFSTPSTAGMSVPIIDPTLELQPDATAGMDTFIGSDNVPNSNFGATTNLTVGGDPNGFKRRGMGKFDVSSIPAAVTVNSSTLRAFCESELATTNYDIGVHRALTQWFEGTKDNAAPGAGEDGSTWNHRNANGSVAWGAAGGLAGTDYVAAVATTTITGTGTTFDWDVTAIVAGWVGGTFTNHGLWFINASETTNNSVKRLTSSDGGTAANRLKLTTIYTEASGALLKRMYQHSARRRS